MTTSTDKPDVAAAKALAYDVLERNREAVAGVSDALFYFGELGMQEVESAALLCEVLEKEGFTVERGVSGFPTGFCATWGSGGPVIAVHTEYDANPDNSQASGVAERKAIVDGAPGHCEGHNCNAAVMVSGAVAAKRAMEKHGLPGRLKIFGAPGEEQLISRPYYVRDGLFRDVDAALHVHIAGEFDTVYGLTHYAAVSAYFTFHGETSHASVTPWMARDALDAVVLMDMGVAQLREHMQTDMRAHRTITHGGDQPNVIPARATVWWTFRAPTAEGARKLFERGKRIAEGAAMMTDTTVSVEVMSAVWPVRTNQGLAEVIQRNIEAVGMPAWTEEEDAFARRLQGAAKAGVNGLSRQVTPLAGPTRQRSPSNDCGDVSWAVPMGRIGFPANIPGIAFHHWGGGAALATSIAHKGTVAGAKALAGTIIDLMTDESRIERVKSTFKAEIGDVVYRPLLPADQKPPVNLNRELMEQFRPLMMPHYPKARPAFSR
jgi:aminobenzoyl-glutamate utilization protein B